MTDYSDLDDSIPSTPSFYEDGPFISPSTGDVQDADASLNMDIDMNMDMEMGVDDMDDMDDMGMLDWGSEESPGGNLSPSSSVSLPLSAATVDSPDASDPDLDSVDLHQPSTSSQSPSLPSSFLSLSSSLSSTSSSSPSSSTSAPGHPRYAHTGQQQQQQGQQQYRPGQRVRINLDAVAPDRQPSFLSASRPSRHHPATHSHAHAHTHTHNSSNPHNSHREGHHTRTHNHTHRSAAQAQEEQLRRLRTQRDVLLREIREDRAARRDRRRNNNQAQSRNDPEVVLLDELFDMEVEQRAAAPPSRAQQQNHQQQTVIDLTDEPDSPVQRTHPLVLPRAPSNPQDPSQPHRNPRRQMSQNRRTPSFARSDGSILGGANPDVIDLTADSPDDQIHEQPHPATRSGVIPPLRRRDRDRRSHASRERAANREFSLFAQLHNFRRSFPALDLPHIMAGFGARLNAHVDVDVQFISQNNVNPPPNPLANNPVDFNYQANGFGGFGGRAPTPKPVFEPLPPPREGFTRESGPDVVVICPSCDEELKYNSEDKEDGPPTKKPKTRKEREEHHFWAVKACGHVFCKKCFDNRKSASLSKFRRDPVSNTKQPKFLCAVDDCDSEISQKTAWVGIFM